MAILEICAGSVESAIAARDGGAKRIELCATLEIGGVTPSAGLIAEARKIEGLVLNVIIRPRGGDFLYNEYEVACMLQDIRTCKQLGVDGVVIGALTADGDIDTAICKELIAATDGMSVTFHRAFDMCRDSRKALEELSGVEIFDKDTFNKIKAVMTILNEIFQTIDTVRSVMEGVEKVKEANLALSKATAAMEAAQQTQTLARKEPTPQIKL